MNNEKHYPLRWNLKAALALIMLLASATLQAQVFSFTSTNPNDGPSNPGNGFSNITCYANGGFAQTACVPTGFPAGTSGTLVFQGRNGAGVQSVVALGGDGNPYLSYGAGGASTNIGGTSSIVMSTGVTPALFISGVTVYQSSGSPQTVTIHTYSDFLTTVTQTTTQLIPSGVATQVSMPTITFSSIDISFPLTIVWGANAFQLGTTPPSPLNGSCGTDNLQTLTSTPVNLCSVGTASGVTSGNSSYTWQCAGSNGGTTDSCAATRNYLVTPSTSLNGSISPNSVQQVAFNAQPVFTLSPNASFISGPVGGTCSGTLVGNAFTTNGVTASCSIIAGFTASITGSCGTAAGVESPFAPLTGQCATGNIAAAGTLPAGWTWSCMGSNGGGDVSCAAPFQTIPGVGDMGSASVSGGTWVVDETNTAGFIGETGHAKSPPSGPPNIAFPFQLFDFTLISGAPGSTATVLVNYPGQIPAGASYWKYGPSPDGHNCSGVACAASHWYQMPSSMAIFTGSAVTLSITDGGVGDDDLTINGIIVDQGGPGVPFSTTIPMMPRWLLMILALMLAAVAYTAPGYRQ